MKFSAPLKYQIFLFLLFAIYYLLFTISPAFAQINPHLNPNTNPDVPKNLHTWTQNVMIEVMSAMSCQLSGIDPTNPKAQCLGVDPKTGNIGYVEGGGGAIGVAGKMIGMLYTPPLHTGDYFKYLADNFGIVKSAHAQAAGFEGLKPVQSLWVAFRNIVYLLFVIIFVVIGLAIMFRVRIDPRTVMSIQNQIPKIIIGILIVTFSFAIAGFLIDLMYVAIFLSYEIIASANITLNVDELSPLVLQGQSALGAAGSINELGVWGIAHDAAVSVKDVVRSLLKIDGCESITSCPTNVFNPFVLAWDIADAIKGKGSVAEFIIDITSYIAGVTMFKFLAGLENPISSSLPVLGEVLSFLQSLGKLATASAAGLLAFSFAEWSLRIGLPYLIAYLVIFIALFFALFRLWFTLIIAYVGILLDVVFAPFWIAAALLPGSPIGFGAWLRSIIANLAAFPAVIIMFLLAKVFIDSFGASGADTGFVPPLIGALPGTDVLGSLIGVGILLMTPNVVAMVKAALKAPSLPAGGPIGTAVAVGGGVLSGPAGIFRQGLSIYAGQWLGSRLPFFGRGRQGEGKIPQVPPPAAGAAARGTP